MEYKSLKLKTEEGKIAAVITLNGKETTVNVLKYLPTRDKKDLVDITLQKSFENGTYNEILLNKYFELYIMYMYTDIEFTDEDKLDEDQLYDELYSNGVITAVIDAMEDDEYNELIGSLQLMKKTREKYGMSVASLLQTLIQNLPENAAAAAQIVENFDKEKYQNVIDFAKSANGGRPI